MDKVVFDIKNLSFSFTKKKILNSLSLKIYEHDFLSVIGPNGSGKTTLLKCLIGINTPPQKTVLFNNIPIEQLNRKELAQQISYVPQISEYLFPFTVKEFLYLARYPHLSRFTSTTANDKKEVETALELTSTKHLANRELNTLSGGERQMIFIAAAIAQGGKIILLDEPTTFLDPKHEEDIYKILIKIHSQLNKTIVVVTHNINNAILFSNKIAVIKEGKLFYYGSADTIVQEKTLENVYEKKFTFITHPDNNKKIVLPEVIKQ